MSKQRGATLAGQLAAMGFGDTARAERLLTGELRLDPDGPDADLVAALAAAADPDLALASLARLNPDPELREALRSDPGLRQRLISVLGASAALGGHLVRHPGDWQLLAGPAGLRRPEPGELRAALLAAVGPNPGDAEPAAAIPGVFCANTAQKTPGIAHDPVPGQRGSAGSAGEQGGSAGSAGEQGASAAKRAESAGAAGPDPVAVLCAAYRSHLLHLAARDLTGADPLPLVMAELAELAAAALEAALAIARSWLPPGCVPAPLAVIAMGKCGGRELNYASDIDVIFVCEAPGEDVPAAGQGKTAGGAGTARTAEATGAAGAAGAAGAIATGEAGSLRTATLLASGLIRVCSQSTPEGTLFPVDPNLRPEGRDGPLVRTLASHLAYYQRWAKTWEFQALLKARPAAGDAGLGAAYLAALAPMVWQAAQRDGFVPDVQAMRRRVLGSLPAGQAGREIKLGPGGLRDIEFAVQLLQLVHGRSDESLRAPATLDALDALAAGGYVGRQDAASLAASYRFLRAVEHLLQLRHLRRTHTLPTDPAVLRQIGRALRAMRVDDAPAGPGQPAAAESGQPGQPGQPGQRERTPGQPERDGPGQRDHGRVGGADPAEELTERWRGHAAQARLLHEKLFYRPLLESVARLPGEAARLSPEAAGQRLEALGYADPVGALRHIQALSSGVSRKAAIQRTLLPVMLGWFAAAPQPDAGLLAFRKVSEALGESPWYLRLLRDDMTVARRMTWLLGSSRYATELLLRAPEAVAMLGDDAQLRPRPAAALQAEAAAIVARRAGTAAATGTAAAADGRAAGTGPDGVTGGLLALRRRELFRTAAADLLDLLDIEQRGEALTAVAGVTVAAALDASIAATERDGGPLPTRICVVAMGRLGGHEMGYASDADVLFVHEPRPGTGDEAATRAAHAVAEEMRALLARPGPDPALIIDAGLRPEGRQGPLVRTLASYRSYYRRWSVAWEAQALLRAEPVAGDRALGQAFAELADEHRYPAGGLPGPSVMEIRRIKARMEAERIPRGVDPALHLKLGPGGLSDVEWVAQLIQLRHAHAVPELRTTRTIGALRAAGQAGLIGAADAEVLVSAWRLAAAIRDAALLARGRPADTVPAGQADLAAVARLLGYPPEAAHDLVQDYRRAARRARAVMERLFYG